MRGINISSILFLLIVLWNIVTISLLSYMKRKSIKSSGIGLLVILSINIILIFCLLYFSSNIGVTHYRLKSDRLPPEFDGFKILQLSDFHTGSFDGGTTKLIKRVESENPNIIVLTGDLIDETVINISSVSELVSQLVLIAGTVMIVSRGLGNNVTVPRILNPPEVVVVTLKCK